MAKYSDALDFYNQLKKSQEYWSDKSDFAAIRGMWLGGGTAFSLLMAGCVLSLGAAVPVAAVIGLATSGVALPGCLWGSSRTWEKVQRNRMYGDDFNYSLYLKGKFAQKVEEISKLPLSKTRKEDRILKAYDELEAQLKEIEENVVATRQIQRPRYGTQITSSATGIEVSEAHKNIAELARIEKQYRQPSASETSNVLKKLTD